MGFDVKWLLVGDAAESSQFLLDNEQETMSIDEAIHFNPDAVFVPGDRVPSFIPGLKVQVFHGLNESKRGNIYPERGMFDLYCTEGPERTKTLSEIAERKQYFKVVETGWVKLDSLFSEDVTEKRMNKKTKPLVLFASTFTPSLSCAEYVYDEIARLSKIGRWNWVVTLHPKMNRETVEKYKNLESENLKYIDTSKVLETMKIANVMVCDNSSVFQEFMLLKKPVVTVNNRNPLKSFINITKVIKLEEAIEQALNPSNELCLEIEKYGPSVTPYLDGHSASRVIAATKVMLDRNWLSRKPKNWIRNFKIRRSLNYWKLNG
ncbi:CDP-glycerol--glycerophosphate glycerophosphotransferase [Vibrio comitans]